MDDLANFCCRSTDCPDFGKRGIGNLSVCDHYGPHRRRVLYGKSCHYRFAERQGTPRFDARLPLATIVSLLRHLAAGTGVRKTPRLLGLSKNTVVRYSKLAGDHAKALDDERVAFPPRTRSTRKGPSSPRRRRTAIPKTPTTTAEATTGTMSPSTPSTAWW